jgi:ABC-type branched-subunit amino acid transport system ATPase component
VSRALALAETVYLLSQGSIVFGGPTDDLDEGELFALYAGEPAPA